MLLRACGLRCELGDSSSCLLFFVLVEEHRVTGNNEMTSTFSIDSGGGVARCGTA